MWRRLSQPAVAGIAEAVLRRDLGQAIKKSATTRAIRYALGRWEALMRFCDDGLPQDICEFSGNVTHMRILN